MPDGFAFGPEGVTAFQGTEKSLPASIPASREQVEQAAKSLPRPRISGDISTWQDLKRLQSK